MSSIDYCKTNSICEEIDQLNEWKYPEDKIKKLKFSGYHRSPCKEKIMYFIGPISKKNRVDESIISQFDLRDEFNKLAFEWKKETGYLSSIPSIISHPSYLKIIAMGKKVIQLILEQLKQEPDLWFWALNAITRENPISTEDLGNIQKMSDSWLSWGRANGYLLTVV